MTRSSIFYWFVTPAILLALLYAAALSCILVFSLREHVPGSLVVGGWTVENFSFLLRPLLIAVFSDTALICLLTALATLLVGYPIAYALVRVRSSFLRATILIIAITPMFTGEITRTYSWLLVLGNSGFINAALLQLGLIAEPVQMMFTLPAVVLVLVHFTLPIMVIILATAISQIDPAYTKASESLGAGPLRSFWHVTLPLSAPGLIAGIITCFAWTFSAFATPQLIGGGKVNMIGNVVYQIGISSFNFPLAAVLSLAGVLFTIVLVGLMRFALRPLDHIRVG
ncbi:ABC transporter permease [Xinfangfangia pollutisoli]|uniref:ABC transporter permease n=1 Tax=Xinfangfangia pollutisoli TaxID=2865960 RepID=UPI001CD7FB34|nr:ABC transporter permease [Xinfangfangia pollutisoli]